MFYLKAASTVLSRSFESPSVITMATFGTSARSPFAVLNMNSLSVLRALAVLVLPLVYGIRSKAASTSRRVLYWFRWNCNHTHRNMLGCVLVIGCTVLFDMLIIKNCIILSRFERIYIKNTFTWLSANKIILWYVLVWVCLFT